MFKKLSILLFLFLTFSFSAKKSYAIQLPVVIINQIRGDESCCQKGSLEIIENINKEKSFSGLSISWAFRYDALINKKYTDFIKNNYENAGLLLEITPLLASKSGVMYHGNQDGSDWYHAKNSMLVGYTQEERKKLIDVGMEEFFSNFKKYPTFTVSWMIDSWSLNYLEKRYSVKLHEVTKEQFETDTYTLDGGIFNAGYYPSINHPLIPGTSATKLQIVMVRQTISDLLKNYGSSDAYFTSQPNDYLSDPQKKGIGYFKDLLSQLINQQAKQTVGIVGFENSYNWSEFGNEYIEQIKEIKRRSDDKKIIVLNPKAYAESFNKIDSQNKSFYFSHQFSNNATSGVLWYFGKTYRVRILLRENEFIIDDFRIFNQLRDPYFQHPAQLDYSYWIVPYAWNGSQMYSQSHLTIEGNNISDLNTEPFGIVIPRSVFKIEEKNETVTVKLPENQSIELNPENMKLSNSIYAKFSSPVNSNLSDLFNSTYKNSYYFKNHPSFNIQFSEDLVKVGWKIEKTFVPLLSLSKDMDGLLLTPQILIPQLMELNPIFQPDRADLAVDSYKSIFYWNNRTAVSGRNPIRLFVLPLNEYGRTTPVASMSVKLSPEVKDAKINYPSDYSYRITPWFVDITSKKPFSSKISVMVNGVKMVSDAGIHMVVDCSKNKIACIFHPQNGVDYIGARIDEFRRNIRKH